MKPLLGLLIPGFLALRRLFAILLMALAIAIVGAVSIKLYKLTQGRAAPGLVSVSTSTILRQIQGLSQLVTVKYVYEKVVVLEDVKWYGESRVLLLAHGVLKAGVDLSAVSEAQVRLDGKSIRLRLGRALLTDVYLDESKTRIIERTTGVLRIYDKDLEQTARRQALEELRRAARQGGILKDAEERARWQLEAFLKGMGFDEVGVEFID